MLKRFEKVWSQYKAGEDVLMSEVSLLDLFLESDESLMGDTEILAQEYLDGRGDVLMSEVSAMDLLNWASEQS